MAPQTHKGGKNAGRDHGNGVRKPGRHNPAIFLVVGWLLAILALIMIIPLGASFYYSGYNELSGQREVMAFLVSSGVSLALGAALIYAFRGSGLYQITVTDGFMIAASGWMAVGVMSAVPYVLSGAIPGPVDALFESLSGLTTTGASVVADLDAIPRGVMLWRHMTQWLGGMGIIVLFVAVLPALGDGGHNLFRAEIPGGANFEKITPRIRHTARAMWIIYVALTLAETALLAVSGLPLYDAVCHSFTTLSTGGFSTWGGSLGDAPGFLAVWVVIVFMFLAGANFTLHFRALTGARQGAYMSSPEFKVYSVVAIIAGVALTLGLILGGPGGYGPGEAVTHGFFQAVSILTTTGYASADFALWSPFAQSFLIILMFVGGCSGSTAGSVKVFRHVLMYKAMVVELFRMANPREVIVPKLDGAPIKEQALRTTIVFMILFIAMFVAGGAFLTILGVDMVTAFSASIASLGNVGPGLGQVGPALHYGNIPDAGKLFLVLEMVMGRLELFGVLVFFLVLARRF